MGGGNAVVFLDQDAGIYDKHGWYTLSSKYLRSPCRSANPMSNQGTHCLINPTVSGTVAAERPGDVEPVFYKYFLLWNHQHIEQNTPFRLMLPQTWIGSGRSISMRAQIFHKSVICNTSSLFESIHPLANLDSDISQWYLQGSTTLEFVHIRIAFTEKIYDINWHKSGIFHRDCAVKN